MDKSIIIIGGGIAGLAAGCYGQMNGYHTQIFELHHLPGGLCTAWERKGYTFDGCIHYLLGSGEGQPFNQMWHELGVAPGAPVRQPQRADPRALAPDGRTLIGYVDPDQLQAHLTAAFPGRCPAGQSAGGRRAPVHPLRHVAACRPNRAR